MLLFSSIIVLKPISDTSVSVHMAYVVSGLFGGLVFVSCIVGITLVRLCLRVSAIQRRSENARVVRRTPTSAGIGGSDALYSAPPTNPNAPPPYVPSEGLQSSDPPPYSADPVNCPLPISIEDTPTSQDQPLIPEVIAESTP